MSSPQANLPEYPLLVSILRNLQIITGEDNIPRLAVDLPKPIIASPYSTRKQVIASIVDGADTPTDPIATSNNSFVGISAYAITEGAFECRFQLQWSFDGLVGGDWHYDPELSFAANTVARSSFDVQVGSPMLYIATNGISSGEMIPWTFFQRPILAPYFRILVTNATALATFNVGFHYQFKQ